MTESESYRNRLRCATRLEFRKFWTAYRYWTIAAAFIASLVVQSIRGLSVANVNLQDILINGLLGAPIALALSVLGTYFIAMRKAAEALDTAAQSEITNRDNIISALRTEISESKLDRAEEYHYKVAEGEIATWTENCKEFVRRIYENHRISAGPDLKNRSRGIDEKELGKCIHKLDGSRIIKKNTSHDRGTQIWWEIVPEYRSAISKLLYTDNKS